jgi:RasGEF N-terminal motif
MSTSGSGGLLEAAAQDTEPMLRRTADGTVEAGTLVGLIDRLIRDTHDRAKDDEFRRVFLATYPLFTTGEDLFRSLKIRFEEMGDVQSFIPSGSSRYS